jgi:hypothetical protein
MSDQLEKLRARAVDALIDYADEMRRRVLDLDAAIAEISGPPAGDGGGDDSGGDDDDSPPPVKPRPRGRPRKAKGDGGPIEQKPAGRGWSAERRAKFAATVAARNGGAAAVAPVAPVSSVLGETRPRSRGDLGPLNHSVIGRSAISVPQEHGKPIPTPDWMRAGA